MIGYCIAQTQTLLFLNYQSIDANVVAKSKAFAARFKERHRELEDYITEVKRKSLILRSV